MKQQPSSNKGRSALLAAAVLAAFATMPAYAGPQNSHRLAPESVPAQSLRRPVKHQQSRPIKANERAPTPASRDNHYIDYDRPDHVDPRLQRHTLRPSSSLTHTAAATCDVNAFASASGSALVSLVKNASVNDCINTLFSLNGTTAGQVFNQSKMVTIANALRSNAVSYAGNNASSTLQLILFLRAGYYVQFYDSADVGTYGTALKNAIRPALDAFVANAHFDDVNDQHGEVLAEFVTLIDSAGENARQLATVRRLLDRYNASYHAYWYMMSAVNSTFTVLFRGHQNADFKAAVQNDPSTASTLANFVSRNAAEAGTDNEYLLSNAARELVRFLQYPSLASTVRPMVRNMIASYRDVGPGASIWVAAADGVDYYDKANCSYYGTCDFRTQLAQDVLPITYQCSPDLRLRAQQLTSSQITQVCNSVINEESYFHQKVNDGGTPVANDYNKVLELVVFHSSTDYQTYSGALFGNDTNNGGMYLEGNPADPANQPRFIAYEAEWMRPTFEVWNLTHEYVHYLDGRFDMYGDFTASTSAPAVWWIEGLAEYISYSYRGLAYQEAITDAGTGQYPLSSVFANDYNSGQELIYRWGYLAARYMFERQPSEVASILGYFRPGNYTGYNSFLNSIRYSHDNDWSSWLGCLSTNQGDTSSCGGSNPPPPPPPNQLPECGGDGMILENGCQRSNVQASRSGDSQYFYIWVPSGATRLTVSTSGGSGNADLYVSARGWPSPTDYDQFSSGPGNNETVDVVYPAGGTYYYIALSADAPYAGVTITASLSP